MIRPVVDMANVEEYQNMMAELTTVPEIRASAIASRVAEKGVGEYKAGTTYNTKSDTITNNINVYARDGQNVNELARVIEQRLSRLNKQQQVGALV